MKSLLLAGLLILSGTQAVNAEEVPTEGWVKISEIRHKYVTSQDGYINLKSIKREGTKFTYLHSWRNVDSNGAFIGDPNDWSNAKPGSGDCASNDKSDIRKKINEYACEGVAVTAEPLGGALESTHRSQRVARSDSESQTPIVEVHTPRPSPRVAAWPSLT